MRRWICCGWLILFFIQVKAAEVPSNLDLVGGLVDQSLIEIQSHMPGEEHQHIRVALHGAAPGLRSWLITRIARGLKTAGHEVYLNDALEDVWALGIVLNTVSIQYTSADSNAEIRRIAELALTVRLSGPDLQVVWADEVALAQEDHIHRRMLDAVESGHLLENPARPPRRGLVRWIEPVLALGTLLVTVFLFYTIRSR